MRCKIIKIGPEDAFADATRRFLNSKGTLEREDQISKWLSGRFVFDDPSPTSSAALIFRQIHVQPIKSKKICKQE